MSVPDVAPAVSVILPTYERRRYVGRAVRSVFAQRFTDWELIVIDDGSTDGTGEALQAFGPRLRYLWQENRGVSAARNAGLRLARGEIVAFLDSDDRWLTDHVETVVAMLERHPEAVLACTCPRLHSAGRRQVAQARLVDALPLLLVDNFLSAGGTAVLREHVLALGGFDERMVVLEDGELWMRLAARGPFSILQRRTFVRQHTLGSLMDRGKREGWFLSAAEQMALSAEALVPTLTRPDASHLAARAEGRVRYYQALRGLAEGDDEAVRTGLASACRRLPELSQDPWFVDSRFKMLAVDPERRLHHYETASRLWPDRRSDAAVFLHGRALLLALRLRRFRKALAVLDGFSAQRFAGVLFRNRGLLAYLLRRRLQSYVHRGRDARQPPVSVQGGQT